MTGECELGGEIVQPLASTRVNSVNEYGSGAHSTYSVWSFRSESGDAAFEIHLTRFELNNSMLYARFTDYSHCKCRRRRLYMGFNFRLVLFLQYLFRCRWEKPTRDMRVFTNKNRIARRHTLSYIIHYLNVSD